MDNLLEEALAGRALAQSSSACGATVEWRTPKPVVGPLPPRDDLAGLDDEILAELDVARRELKPSCCPVYEHYCRREADGTVTLRPLEEDEALARSDIRATRVVRVGNNEFHEGPKVTSFELARRAQMGTTVRTSKAVGMRKRVTESVLTSCVRHVPFRAEGSNEVAPRRVAQIERNANTAAASEVGKWQLKMHILDPTNVCPAYNVQ